MVEAEAAEDVEVATDAAAAVAEEENEALPATVGRTATALTPAPIANAKPKGTSTTPPLPTCKAAARSAATGSPDSVGQQHLETFYSP